MAGLILFLAGFQKLTGMGVGGVTGFFGNVGIPAPEIMAPLVVAFELIGGLMLIVGAFTRVVGALMAIQFLVAALVVNLPSQPGWNAARLDLLLAAAGVAFLLSGAGKLSVDEWLANRRAAPAERRSATFA